jgi:hypothetical protein
MAESSEKKIERLQHELQIVSSLVENLYVTEYARFRDGVSRFDRFAKQLKENFRGVTIPGADPALADHASQGWSEALEPILDRISHRLKDARARKLNGCHKRPILLVGWPRTCCSARRRLDPLPAVPAEFVGF